eukprot:TRINITY_DN48325_c0_g1_i1.p1 TRINITY_DN48325_c0_g1~~TRINITY_DN48325_c0_g1_i1.p1  ORF type:complete len:454 (-),score=42.69 TRINITY_DN48325_c0_g1_i1:99-1460(-)
MIVFRDTCCSLTRDRTGTMSSFFLGPCSVTGKTKGIVGHVFAIAIGTVRAIQRNGAIVARRPILWMMILKVAEELVRLWICKWQYRLGRSRVLGIAEEIDGEIIQGCLMSTEHLLSFGRIEKRTLFSKPLLDVLGGNQYLVQTVLQAAADCRANCHNGVVMRWLPPSERYHVLQACLHVTSSIFGTNFIHLNALEGESSNMFKTTWYCLTVTSPTHSDLDPACQTTLAGINSTTYPGDKSGTPRATVRVTLVNESEIRRIADGKLMPPKWGFFNSRHARRFRLLADIAANFQLQLLRTPSGGSSSSSQNAFASERVHASPSKSDGGLMKRVQSQPSLVQPPETATKLGHSSVRRVARAHARGPGHEDTLRGISRNGAESECAATNMGKTVIDENNCFLRLHVPHYIGPGARALAGASDAARAALLGDRKVGSFGSHHHRKGSTSDSTDGETTG